MKEFSSAIEIIDTLMIDKDQYLYRGYQNENQMISRLGRWGLENDEKNLLIDFVNLDIFKEKIMLNTLSQVIELAQHFEIPTRFLDLSYDIKVALYFANEYHKESDEVTYLARFKRESFVRSDGYEAKLADLDTCTLGDLDNYTLDELDIISIFHENSKIHVENGQFLTYDLFISKLMDYSLNDNISLHNNPRISAQKGCFVVFKEPNNMLVAPETFKLKLKSSEKKKLLDWINKQRINANESEFFPELDHNYSELICECKKIVAKYKKS